VSTARPRGLGKGLGALIPTTPTGILSDQSRAEAPVSRETEGSAGGVATLAPPAAPALGVLPIDRTPSPAAASAPPIPAQPSGEDELQPVPGAYFAEIPQLEIRPNASQPRTEFDEEAMAELVHSIKTVGLLQPIVVRRLAVPEDGHRYELIMGERRWRASQEAGLPAIPAIVRDTSDDKMLLDALLENLHRSQLNPLEEAAAYSQLLQDFGCTHEELADKIGRSRPHVSNYLRLLNLPPAIQLRVAAGVLSAGHARALLRLPSVGEQEKLATRIVREGLSVRTVEEIAAMGDAEAGSLTAAEDYLDLEDKPRNAKRIRKGSRSPVLDDFESQLSDQLETRVTIALGPVKGKMIVEFSDMEDLTRIRKIMMRD
jgi:ParB family transcriptional regulator, chromosome partitioning protein